MAFHVCCGSRGKQRRMKLLAPVSVCLVLGRQPRADAVPRETHAVDHPRRGVLNTRGVSGRDKRDETSAPPILPCVWRHFSGIDDAVSLRVRVQRKQRSPPPRWRSRLTDMRTDTRGRWQRSAGWHAGLELSGSAVIYHSTGIKRGIKTGFRTARHTESSMEGPMGRPMGITTVIGMARP